MDHELALLDRDGQFAFRRQPSPRQNDHNPDDEHRDKCADRQHQELFAAKVCQHLLARLDGNGHPAVAMSNCKQTAAGHAVPVPRHDRLQKIRIRSVQFADQFPRFACEGKLDAGIDDDVDEPQGIDQCVVISVVQRHRRLAAGDERLHADGDLDPAVDRIVSGNVFDAGVGLAPGCAGQIAILEVADLLDRSGVETQAPHFGDMPGGARLFGRSGDRDKRAANLGERIVGPRDDASREIGQTLLFGVESQRPGHIERARNRQRCAENAQHDRDGNNPGPPHVRPLVCGCPSGDHTMPARKRR